MGETLVLTRRDVRDLLSLDDCIVAVDDAFRLHAEGKSLAPGVLGVPSREGGFHVKAAGLECASPLLRGQDQRELPGQPAATRPSRNPGSDRALRRARTAARWR